MTGLPAGVYCDVITGPPAASACSGQAVTVTSAGDATLTVPSRDAVAVDVDAALPVT